MHRILYIFLPDWPIDRLRRNGLLPRLTGDKPADEVSSFPRQREPGAGDGTAGRWPPADAGVTKKNGEEEPPFATVVTANGRRLLAAVNPAAAAKGIVAGLPLADALSFLPGLATRPAEPAEDAAALRRLAEWCGRYSPWTAPDFSQDHGHDGVKIEVTGSAHLWGGEAELAADLSRRLARQGIVHRLALADTLGAAWGLARHAAAGQPLIVAPDQTGAAIAPLPIAALRLDPAIVQGLQRVGLRRIGDVVVMPRDALARRFGEDVARRLDQAQGALPEPLSPLGEVPSRRVRLSFVEPIADPADLARAAERLTGDLVTRLAREGMGARRLDLGFHRVDGRVEHIRIGTARPSRDPVHLARLMIGKLDAIDPGLGIEDAILAAFAVEPLAPGQIEAPLPVTAHPHPDPDPPPPAGEGARLERRRSPSPSPAGGGGLGWGPGLAPLLDQIGARLGPDAVVRLEARESHIPERASVAMPIADNPHPDPPPLAGEGDGRLRCAPSPAGGGGSGWGTDPPNGPRPVRLLAPPEPIEAVLWIMPDDPPSRFIWRRLVHRVARADGPERVAEEWWHPDGGPAAAAGDPPWSAGAIRDYYRVEDETGRRFWLFRAGLPGDPPPRWFVHGVFA